jgi:hypothetical protein
VLGGGVVPGKTSLPISLVLVERKLGVGSVRDHIYLYNVTASPDIHLAVPPNLLNCLG